MFDLLFANFDLLTVSLTKLFLLGIWPSFMACKYSFQVAGFEFAEGSGDAVSKETLSSEQGEQNELVATDSKSSAENWMGVEVGCWLSGGLFRGGCGLRMGMGLGECIRGGQHGRWGVMDALGRRDGAAEHMDGSTICSGWR